MTTDQLARTSVVIVGGGAAGLAVANRLLRKQPDLKVTIIEPSDDITTNPHGR